MDNKFPNRRGQVYTEQIAIRVEPELKDELARLKRVTKKDVQEALRIVIREVAIKLKEESEAS